MPQKRVDFKTDVAPWRWLWWGFVTLILSPLWIAGFGLALLLAAIPITPTRIARRNLRERLGCVGIRQWATVVGVYLNYLIYGLEVLIYWPLSAVIEVNSKAYFEFLDALSQAYGLDQRKRGFLFLGGHYSAIEQAGGTTNRFLRMRGFPSLAVLAKPAPLRVFTVLMDAYRKARSLEVIWTGGRQSLWTQISEMFGKGHSLGMIVDQKPGRGGVFLNFFGAFASFPFRGVAHALKSEVPVVATNARRLAPGVFATEFLHIPTVDALIVDSAALGRAEAAQPRDSRPAVIWSVPLTPSANGVPERDPDAHDSDENQAAAAAVLAHFAGWLESVIRESPYQWCWDYRKWSREPPGGNSLS